MTFFLQKISREETQRSRSQGAKDGRTQSAAQQAKRTDGSIGEITAKSRRYNSRYHGAQ